MQIAKIQKTADCKREGERMRNDEVLWVEERENVEKISQSGNRNPRIWRENEKWEEIEKSSFKNK
ncbi:conserved hypothetical protein [Ricinus communis]|uniref:Uncharacterized protein n=1 Tax=Ricinus communis TaxID=3988 RepID=B9SSM3_RICCO|nr:conserved hypothetical protein [Ricinus communis]